MDPIGNAPHKEVDSVADTMLMFGLIAGAILGSVTIVLLRNNWLPALVVIVVGIVALRYLFRPYRLK
jgi:uncharacterized membrane protein YfcA